MKLGKAKYGGDFVPTKYWKLKDGESTYRILPPLGDLADDGIWSVFYKVHYGYRNTSGKMRVFQSSLVTDRKTKMIEVPDAALERIERLKSELEKAKAAGNVPAMGKFKDLLQMYNLDNNHYVNAMDSQGNIGVLKLRHRAKQALDAAIKKLNASNIDPLSPDDGRFFTFTRTGNGLDTTFQVAVAQESLTVPNVGEVKRDLTHRLTPEIIARLGKEARELHKLFKKPTADEVARIVRESDINSGKSRAVDEIFDVRGGEATPDEGADYSEDEGPAGGSGGTGGSVSGSTVLAGDTSVGSGGNSGTAVLSSTGDTFTNDVSASSPAPTTAAKVSQMNDADFQNYLKTLGV